MDESLLKIVSDKIYEKIGVKVRGFVNPTEPREGISFWFENYNRGNGPVFTIRPSGLKRHLISMKFGAYAVPCIDHIKQNANDDAYALAYAFIDQLRKMYDLKINGQLPDDNWKVDVGFEIEVLRKNVEQKNVGSLVNSVEIIMVPIMAAVAELIGYEAIEDESGDEEGSVYSVVVTKRERSPRNRLLCLSIHGEACGVCGLDPRDIYGDDMGLIIEVHHIEPLSEMEKARAYNPRTDLIPLCPNCHRAIHSKKPALKPDELKAVLRNDF